MPLPKPKKGEKKNEFISRCMADEVMRTEFTDQDRRVAVCYKLFKKKQ